MITKIKYLFFLFVFSSCNLSQNEEKTINDNDQQSFISTYDSDTGEDYSQNKNRNNDDEDETNSDCGYRDGTYSALVDYYNPKTDYFATYTLDIEVSDCMVVQINFPKGGYLDEDHITYTDLDDSGVATVDGEDGKVFEIQIEN